MGFEIASLTFIYALLADNVLLPQHNCCRHGKCSIPVYLGRGNDVVNTSIIFATGVDWTKHVISACRLIADIKMKDIIMQISSSIIPSDLICQNF